MDYVTQRMLSTPHVYLDVETTSADPARDRITEIGLVYRILRKALADPRRLVLFDLRAATPAFAWRAVDADDPIQ